MGRVMMDWDANQLPALTTPSLLVNVDAVRRNIARMVDIAGEANCLRPHVKTHKSSDVIGMQCDAGIGSFKAANLTEARCAIGGGARDIVLAHSPVGPKIAGLADLCDQFPDVRLSTIVDDADHLANLNEVFMGRDTGLDVWIDVDCGMGRTGVLAGDVPALVQRIAACDRLWLVGLHVYDGHLHQPSVQQRTQAVRAIHQDVLTTTAQIGVDRVIVGGSPTYAIWVDQVRQHPGELTWEFSPGTNVYWDTGYGSAFAELPFEIAAGVLATVISRPLGPDGKQRYCLDIGTKSLASEMPLDQRVGLVSQPDAYIVSQSEEHLVVEGTTGAPWKVGHRVLALPRHICPTVAKFHQATVIDDMMNVVGTWPIAARHGLC